MNAVLDINLDSKLSVSVHRELSGLTGHPIFIS